MNTPANAYVEQLLGFKCAADYLDSGVLPRRNKSKEISESMGAFMAVRNALGPARFGDKDISLLDVGCGHAPRTAALFALMTNWQCYAVDPVVKRQARNVSRCWATDVTLDDAMCNRHVALSSSCPLVVVAVHGHAPLAPLEPLIGKREMLVVAIPCCVPQVLRHEADCNYQEYSDPHIMSEQRTVKVWHFTDARQP